MRLSEVQILPVLPKNVLRGREVGRSREAHNLKIAGSNPARATTPGWWNW